MRPLHHQEHRHDRRMAKRSTKPVPSGIVRALADQLRREGTVWEGRGRRAVDETRPSLISVLMARLGLSRSVIQRALHGRSRAAPRQGSRYHSSSGHLTSRSESRSEIVKQGPKAGSNAYYRAITAAMAAAHTLPGTRAERPGLAAPLPAGAPPTPSKYTSKNPDSKHLQDLSAIPSEQSPVPGARGLEAIGLQARPLPGRQSVSATSAAAASSTPGIAAPDQAVRIQSRQLLEDGIDLVLTQGAPDAELRHLLIEVQRLLSLPPG